MNAPFSKERFEQFPVVGILRGIEQEALVPIVKAVVAGGLTNLEVTMNTPDAVGQIRSAIETGGGSLNVGAGTVTDLQVLDDALAAGASFVVTPIFEADVIRRCVDLSIPVFPGALSPTEIVRAWDLGATMVKVFPAEVVGPSFIKSVKAPLPHIKLMPTGGVDLAALSEYLDAGADGFGVGSPLFSRDRVLAGDWAWIEARCRAFKEAYEQAIEQRR